MSLSTVSLNCGYPMFWFLCHSLYFITCHTLRHFYTKVQTSIPFVSLVLCEGSISEWQLVTWNTRFCDLWQLEIWANRRYSSNKHPGFLLLYWSCTDRSFARVHFDHNVIFCGLRGNARVCARVRSCVFAHTHLHMRPAHLDRRDTVTILSCWSASLE